MALTIKRFERLVRNGVAGRHFDKNGLYLIVAAKGSGHWERRYQKDHRAHWMSIGKIDALDLEEARDENKKVSDLLRKGDDPLAAKRADRAAKAVSAVKMVPTFGECAKEYITANERGWKSKKHADQWVTSLLGKNARGGPAETDYCKSIRDLPVDAIDTALVQKVIQPYWNERTVTMGRIRGRIEKVLDRAKVLGHRSAENPARWTGHLDQLLPKRSQVAPVENQPALPYRDLPTFMRDLRQREGISARALEFLILTACRTSDAIEAKWSEIDKNSKLWTISKERMKGQRGKRKRDHVVPLSPQAIALLDALPREGDWIFPGTSAGDPISNSAMAAVLDRMNEARAKSGLPKWTDPHQDDREVVVHGFRSTFRDWAGDMTEYPNEMCELALAHSLSDKVEAAYRRGVMLEKRRRMMTDYANFAISTRPKKTATATVVPIRA